jgi:alcohol dehydrogenase class IV
MQDRPTAIELLEAAAQFIDRDIVPVTEGTRKFQARVAANVMRIIAREISLDESQLREEVALLASLLGHPRPTQENLTQLREAAVKLNAELGEKIRAGESDAGGWRADVLRVVRKLVEDKLRIANPRYLDADLAARGMK